MRSCCLDPEVLSFARTQRDRMENVLTQSANVKRKVMVRLYKYNLASIITMLDNIDERIVYAKEYL